MQATLYVNSDDKRRLNKTLTSPLPVTVLLKKDTDLLAPYIELAFFDNFSNYNYIYISELKRYYFISDSKINVGGIITLECKVDVLMSWKDSIKLLTGITSRSKTNNILLNDGQMKILARNNIIQHNFISSELYKSLGVRNYCIVLNVIGKGSAETTSASNEVE